jgi:type II secretory ATPase GspE/PulE/Tfp pilus assembly ATPase PilB-like protein
MIERMQALPSTLIGTCLTVATATPTDPTISENLRFATNCQIELVCSRSNQIGEKIAAIFDQYEDSVEDLIDELGDLDVQVDDEPELEKINESDSKVINLVNKVLLDANNKGISDIHFEPGLGHQSLKIRYRKDGICYTVHQIAATYKAAVISRIKIISKLDIAEHRRPQSRKILLKKAGERIEYRVEITPTVGGQEDAVLRVLSSARSFSLQELGFSANNLEHFKELLENLTALFSVLAQRVPAKPPVCIRPWLRSIHRRPTSGQQKTLLKSLRKGCARSRSTPRSALPLRMPCVLSCAPIPT